jgi:hypothetical protein
MELEVRLSRWAAHVDGLQQCEKRLIGITEELERLERQLNFSESVHVQSAQRRICAQRQALRERIQSMKALSQGLERVGRIYEEKEQMILDCIEQGRVPGAWTTAQEGSGGMAAIYMPDWAGEPALCEAEDHMPPEMADRVQETIVLKG